MEYIDKKMVKNYFLYSIKMSFSFSPYVDKPAIRTVSKYSVEHDLMDHEVALPKSHLKRAEFNKLKREDFDMSMMTDDDLECAKRYPIFDMSKDEVEELAKKNGIDVKGMSKIDMCHALNANGVVIKKSMDDNNLLKTDDAMGGRRKRGCRRSKDGLARNSKGRFCKVKKAKRSSSKRRSSKRSARK